MLKVFLVVIHSITWAQVTKAKTCFNKTKKEANARNPSKHIQGKNVIGVGTLIDNT